MWRSTVVQDPEHAERAKVIYAESIRARVEPARVGDFVVVDLESGDFEVDSEKLAALDRLRARRPDAKPFLLRAGYPTAAVLGGPFRGRSR
jgi:hypothetical protein